MLPDDLQVAEVEGGRLRVGDVRLALLVHQDAARRDDPPRPAQVEHPAHHVEHVDAHVAHDAVAVLHERPPASRMDERVVRPHRRRARSTSRSRGSRAARCRADCLGRACGSSSRSRPGRSCRACLRGRSGRGPRSRCGVLRRWVPTCTTRLCLRAAASMAWPSTTSTLIGFWT